MKKAVSAFLLVIIMTLSLTSCFASEGAMDYFLTLKINNPDMTVNGEVLAIDPGRGTAPLIRGGRTLVPIRAIIEKIGGKVSWNAIDKKITLNYQNDEIVLKIDSDTAYINGESKTLDVAPTIINERTLMPIRFIAEGFGFSVLWDGDSETVHISAYAGRRHPLAVHFIDVGQGDSIFMQLPNGETLLIDGGPDADTVTDYIKAMGYKKISYVIATHPDADHIYGLPKVLGSFKVGKFYMPAKEHTTKVCERLLDSVEKNGCEAIYAVAGREVVNTPGLSVRFVAPVKYYSDNNEISAVVKLVYNENSFLFTGDAEKKSEQDIISEGYDVSADVLKIGHHGSKTSTSEEFLRRVNPEMAVISVGSDNKYGHPATEIINLLNSGNIKIYRTDTDGTIIFLCDGENYEIKQGEGK